MTDRDPNELLGCLRKPPKGYEWCDIFGDFDTLDEQCKAGNPPDEWRNESVEQLLAEKARYESGKQAENAGRIAGLEAELAEIKQRRAVGQESTRARIERASEVLLRERDDAREEVDYLRTMLRMVAESCSGMTDEHGLTYASFDREDIEQINLAVEMPSKAIEHVEEAGDV